MKLFAKATIFFVFGIISINSYCQVNINDLYQTGSVWEEIHTHRLGMGTTHYTTYQIKIGGDTVIASSTYKKLNLMLIGNSIVANHNFGTIGGIRVNNRQVFFIRTKTLPSTMPTPSQTYNWQSYTVNNFPLINEAILYDFNLTVGNTLTWKPNDSTVLSVGSVMANNNQVLETYAWSPAPYIEKWTEGIGSNFGFFGSYRPFNFTSFFTLECFSSPTLSYPANCSISPLAVKDVITENRNINIYPNPLNENILNIEVLGSEAIKTVTIYNSLGSKVIQKNFAQLPSQLEIDLSQGLYIIQLTTKEGRIVTKRLIKN